MKFRRFGRTEIEMPVFSCGGMRYQHKWSDVDPSEIPPDNQANLEATIHRAFELGINHIETARGYGTSEMQLGRVLPTLPREQLIVQTKVAPTADPREFRKTFERSLAYLQLDYVDLFSIHGINTAELLDWTIREGGCLEVAQQLQREGRVHHIGFSTHATPAVIMAAIQTGEFDYVNLHWYFVNDANWGCIEEARRYDLGIFIISPNDKGGKLYAPPAKLVELCAPLSPMAFNDLYCLARPEVHTLSLGASKPEDFDEHLRALEYYDLAAEITAPIEQRLRAEMTSVLGAEWMNHWWRDLPEWTETPNELNIAEILRLWTLAKSLDLVEFGKMRYNLLGNGGHWFPGTNAAKFDAAQITRMLDGHPFAEKIPVLLTQAHELLQDKEVKRLSQE
jgi:predicted aldo/keto reductase-like oxidoreductase